MTLGKVVEYGVLLLLALIGAGGLWRLLDWWERRRTRGGGAVARAVALSTEDRAWVDQFQERATEAERAAGAARAEADGARRASHDAMVSTGRLSAEVEALTTQVHALSRQVATVRGWIHDPGMTIDRLRFLVPPPILPGPSNGV